MKIVKYIHHEKISNNKITDKSIIYFKSLRSLEEVSIATTKITEKGIKKLIEEIEKEFTKGTKTVEVIHGVKDFI